MYMVYISGEIADRGIVDGFSFDSGILMKQSPQTTKALIPGISESTAGKLTIFLRALAFPGSTKAQLRVASGNAPS